MRLNLGCNNRIRPGYINVDRDQYPGVDVVGDVFKLDKVEDNSVDEIYASHILEHAPHPRTLEVLKEWCRVLKPGGMLKVAVPDFKRAVEIYLKCGMQDWIRNFLWGDQGYEGAFHYTGFDEGSLTKLLKEAGFGEVSRVDQLPGCQELECSNNISNIDGKRVSLNLVAVKE